MLPRWIPANEQPLFHFGSAEETYSGVSAPAISTRIPPALSPSKFVDLTRERYFEPLRSSR